MPFKMPRITANQVIRVLLKKGFVKIDQSGSHQKWKHPETGRQTIISYHRNAIIHPKTLKRILEGADIEINEFIKLLKN